MDYTIREEQAGDIPAIASLIKAAFEGLPYSEGLEGAIVKNLRKNNKLTLSLVAIAENEVIGHIAFSPVTIDREHEQWYGLGPLSVSPARHRQGIGSALVREGLERIKRSGANGCVVLGNPAYYQRFGFKTNPGLRCDGYPAAHFTALPFCGEELPTGAAEFHESFWAANASEDDR
jgi:putative acetyltransferase